MTYEERYIPVNQFSRPGTKRSFTRNVVWHYTGNPGATAEGHFHYFGENLARQDPFDDKKDTYASAHVFIDRTKTLVIIPLDEIAYHATQANPYSVGVELCIEADGSFHPETVRRAIEFGVFLNKKYNLRTSDYLRHYDVTGKICPKPWVDNPAAWADFKQRVDMLQSGKGANRVPNWTEEQWSFFADGLNSAYHASVNGELLHPILSDYTWCAKAYNHELTVDETLWLIGVMTMKSAGIWLG